MRSIDWLRGHLLLSTPNLDDADFLRTVVLLAEHGNEGAVGLVLTRLGASTVADAVPAVAGLMPAGARVSLGGPVQPQTISVLVEIRDRAPNNRPILGDVFLLAAVSDIQAVAGRARRARVFAGHAGWGPGQLEAEIAQGDWLIDRAGPDDIFVTEPHELAGAVLARLGARHPLLRTMPPQPGLN